MAGVPCSVTAWDYFTTINGQYTMEYGGGTSCAGNIGTRTIDVVPQVFNLVDGQPLWFSIGGAGLFQGPTAMSPLRLSGSRAAVAWHLYRVLVYGEVTTMHGTIASTASTTACSSCEGTQPELSIAWPKGWVYTVPPVTVRMPGINCSVTAFGTSFPYINNTPTINYGGELICNTSVPGTKRLTIAVEVAGQERPLTYYTVSGSTLTAGPTTGPYLYQETSRTAYIGHGYRAAITGSVTYNGKTTSATAYSKTTGP